MDCFDLHCKKALLEIRELLKETNQKLSHLIEQNKVERDIFFRGDKRYWNGDSD